MGAVPLAVPDANDPSLVRDLPVPSNFQVFASPQGVSATWDAGKFPVMKLENMRLTPIQCTARTTTTFRCLLTAARIPFHHRHRHPIDGIVNGHKLDGRMLSPFERELVTLG